jgi:SPP1 family phage portal protein
VLTRTNEIRPEINNPVVENTAYEIVEFKTGYLTYDAIQYVSTSDDGDVSKKVDLLNKYMKVRDKSAQDAELAWWFYLCGLAYRIVLPAKDDAESPFVIYGLDPRSTFVVKRNSLGKPPVMSVMCVERDDGTMVYSIYTPKVYFEVENLITITKSEPNPIGEIPVIEYPANYMRLGAFEVVKSLMDAVNEIESDRTDAIENFVKAILLFHNVSITEEELKMLREKGALEFKDVDPNLKAEIKYLVEELDQGQTQVVVNHMNERILEICGMPNRNGGGKSTSDTGKAVIYRDGWGAAEYRAKLTENYYRRAENAFLRVLLKICRDLDVLDLKMIDIEVRMPRRNYDNIKEKADVLTMMLNNNKIAPKLAFEHCGMFVDPEIAYQESSAYAEEYQKRMLEQMNRDAGVGDEPDDGMTYVAGHWRNDNCSANDV